MFLSVEEVAEFTGYTRRSAQARWLQTEGFPFVIGGDGKLKVLRSVVVDRLGGLPVTRRREPRLRLEGATCAKKAQ